MVHLSGKFIAITVIYNFRVVHIWRDGNVDESQKRMRTITLDNGLGGKIRPLSKRVSQHAWLLTVIDLAGSDY